MSGACDILIVGTGAFAQRIACDLAATARAPTRVLIAGRNLLRLAWISTAARARAHIFQRPVAIEALPLDLDKDDAVELLRCHKPSVVVQTASLQTASVIAGASNAWTRLVAQGGLSATAVFQAVLTARVARAVARASPASRLVNCCFPDVVNGLVAAMGLPLTCGVGNIAILAHAFASVLEGRQRPKLQMLCHYQNIQAWRLPPERRAGSAPRVWLESEEVADPMSRFAAVQLTPEPVIDVSGASAVPLLLALAHRRPWTGHAPGPLGLPGGYPVRVRRGELGLDLPAGMNREAAIAFNLRHEQENGLVVENGGFARYTGRLNEALRAQSPDLAGGFEVSALEEVWPAMAALRTRLLAQPA